jgi:hypothetical protein
MHKETNGLTLKALAQRPCVTRTRGGAGTACMARPLPSAVAALAASAHLALAEGGK